MNAQFINIITIITSYFFTNDSHEFDYIFKRDDQETWQGQVKRHCLHGLWQGPLWLAGPEGQITLNPGWANKLDTNWLGEGIRRWLEGCFFKIWCHWVWCCIQGTFLDFISWRVELRSFYMEIHHLGWESGAQSNFMHVHGPPCCVPFLQPWRICVPLTWWGCFSSSGYSPAPHF